MHLAPIVLFVYNRPWHTEQTLKALSQNTLASESILFIYADGPKNNANEDTLQKIKETRNIIRQEHWCKEVTIVESDTNMGLANSIVTGVTEIVNKYGSIIVLEDDINVSPYFLDFMNDGLNVYRNESKVISIHGYNYPIETKGLPDTFFIKGADCWGWATWSTEWRLFDIDSEKLLKKIEETQAEYDFDIQGSYPYTQMLRNQRDKKINSWAICWYASAYLNDKYTLYPKSSVIYNIGFDKSGTHNADFDYFNSNEWNNAKPVKVEAHNIIETNQLALSRWKVYHERNKTRISNKTVNKFHFLKAFGAKAFKKIFNNTNERIKLPELMWSGNYESWDDAERKSVGYDADIILEKVKTSALKVKKGEAAYERDSVVFDVLEFSMPLLEIFKSISFENGGILNVFDFGGSLGSSYFQYRNLLNNLKELRWKIIEQPHFVNCGRQFIEDEQLKFYYSIDEAITRDEVKVLFLASVLQYLKEPTKIIEAFLMYKFDYIIIDRTGFIEGNEDRITLQTVPQSIYKASYPVWFFNEEKFINTFNNGYNVVRSFLSEVSPPMILEDGKNVCWKGFYLTRK